MSNPKRILVVAGELSGDRYAAMIVDEIKTRGTWSVLAIGGPLLRDASDYFIGDCTSYAAVGIRSIFAAAPVFRVFDKMDQIIDESPVDCAIIVDFPHYNFEVARRLTRRSVPIFTVITPNFWIWKDRRSAQKISAYSKQIVTIFPPEYALYRSIEAAVGYFGNPLVDRISPKLSRDRRPYIGDGTDRPIRVGLFPGSRRAELKLLLRATVQTAVELSKRSPRFEFVMPIAREEFRGMVVDEIRRNKNCAITIVSPLTSEEMDGLDVAICATGTMTLELCLNRVPMVVLGALSPLSYAFATWFLRIKLAYCALPNLIAGWKVVPEFMQHQIRPNNVAQEVCRLLGPVDQESQQQKYTEFITLLKGPAQRPIVPQIVDYLGLDN